MSGRVRFLDTRPLRSSRPFRDLWIGTSASQLGGLSATLAIAAVAAAKTHRRAYRTPSAAKEPTAPGVADAATATGQACRSQPSREQSEADHSDRNRVVRTW
nr:hypothetical protein OH820_19565 [Streptomyces sp. NBC_00857]